MAEAQFVVVPNANETAHGNGVLNTVIRDSGNPRAYQMGISSSQLGSLAANETLITGISFRLATSAANATNWPATTITYSNYEIRLAQLVNAPGSMSTTYADNMGADATLVRSGTLTIEPDAYPGGAVTPGVNGWGTQINFQTPYLYKGGNLLIEIRHPGSDTVGTRFLDALTTAAPGYNTDFQALSASTFAATTGTAASFTINRLATAPVPEPATMLALGTGLVVLLRRRARR